MIADKPMLLIMSQGNQSPLKKEKLDNGAADAQLNRVYERLTVATGRAIRAKPIKLCVSADPCPRLP